MLFESFIITVNYRSRLCELEIRECYGNLNVRAFEVVQGGIAVLSLVYKDKEWHMAIMEGLHPVVKQDTEDFMSQELKKILSQAIMAHYQLIAGKRTSKK